jgi:hypothetical protein
MGGLRVNIRIGLYHLQVHWNWKVEIKRNNMHIGLPYGWFSVYEFKPFKKF